MVFFDHDVSTPESVATIDAIVNENYVFSDDTNHSMFRRHCRSAPSFSYKSKVEPMSISECRHQKRSTYARADETCVICKKMKALHRFLKQFCHFIEMRLSVYAWLAMMRFTDEFH